MSERESDAEIAARNAESAKRTPWMLPEPLSCPECRGPALSIHDEESGEIRYQCDDFRCPGSDRLWKPSEWNRLERSNP